MATRDYEKVFFYGLQPPIDPSRVAMMARSTTRQSGFSSGTLTLTLEEPSSSSSQPSPPQTLVLRLKPPKKKVTWKEGTVDNEFLGRKRSKKCCIFHKQKPFDEDESDDEDGHGPNCANAHDHGMQDSAVRGAMGSI